MYRFGISLVLALAIAVAAGLTNPSTGYARTDNANANVIEAQDNSHVGLVTAYTAGQSITIMDRDGHLITFELAQSLKIIPAHRASLLAVGAYVTIIAPNNVEGGKLIAAGIVIHPGIPGGFPQPSQTNTAAPIETETPPVTETPTSLEAATATPTAVATETPIVTPTALGPSTETPTATPPGTAGEVQSILDALRAFLRQIFSG